MSGVSLLVILQGWVKAGFLRGIAGLGSATDRDISSTHLNSTPSTQHVSHYLGWVGGDPATVYILLIIYRVGGGGGGCNYI